MRRMVVTKEELEQGYDYPILHFPKYTSQLINWANQNAQGTRPRMVGQLSDLFPQYREETEEHSLSSWATWYLQRYPDAIERATDKIEAQVSNLKEAIQLIDRRMIHDWVTDLVINKTYLGLYYQQVILSCMAREANDSWRLADSREEAKGIDGYVGNSPYSIKPHSYKMMDRLQEHIDAVMIYYTVNNSGDLIFEVNDGTSSN